MNYEKEKSDQVALPLKKPYRTPKLTVHGTVRKITGQLKDSGPGDCFSEQHFFKVCGPGDFFHTSTFS
jgi:hypothetical protein